MLGKAAMMAVLLAPTASIARHDGHRTAAKPVRWFNVAASPRRMDADRVPNCVLGRLEEKTIDGNRLLSPEKAASMIQFAVRTGAACRLELAAARQSLAVLAEFALPLPSSFLTPSGIFGFGAGDAGCLGRSLPAAIAPALAGVALPLPSAFLTSFLTSLSGSFGFGAGDAGCLGGSLPATVAPVLAEAALPLPSAFLTSFLTSLSGTFAFGTADAGPLSTSLPPTVAPVLAEAGLPLPSAFLP